MQCTVVQCTVYSVQWFIMVCNHLVFHDAAPHPAKHTYMNNIHVLLACRVAGQAQHNAALATEDMLKLRAAIHHLEVQHGLPATERGGVSSRSASPGPPRASLDVQARVPWHPAGRNRAPLPAHKATTDTCAVSASHHKLATDIEVSQSWHPAGRDVSFPVCTQGSTQCLLGT